MTVSRPAVSVVVPFFGDATDAAATVAGLEPLATRADDEIILVDNAGFGSAVTAPDSVRVVAATDEQSSYYARNVGAEEAQNDWVLFIDSDCRPMPDLLDAYFAEPVTGEVAILAGAVRSDPYQDALVARYARERGHISELWHVNRASPHPSGPTANLMLRRATWDSLGGFFEGIRSGEDIELCFRIQDAGWVLLHRPDAVVHHVHPESLWAMLRKARRHAAGRTWVTRRYPDAYDTFGAPRRILRSALGSLVWLLTGRFERSAFKALDCLRTLAEVDGLYRGDNRAPRHGASEQHSTGDGLGIAVFVDGFPARSETFVYNEVETMRDLGVDVSIVSSARPERIERLVARHQPATQLEDEPIVGKFVALAWLVARHPFRCAADLRDRRRWKREEEVWPLASIAPIAARLATSRPHLHAHFAAGACLHAMRLSRILGLKYSVTAHAFDIFQKPRNLREKLEGADLAVGESDYAVDHLKSLVRQKHREKVIRIPTGVRPEFFELSKPPADGYVLAIGRLIEKKGFEHLIGAISKFEATARPRVVIAGDGPLREDLARKAETLGVQDWIEVRRNLWGPSAVRSALAGAVCLCAPSVIAADGDRDDMPVVIYEALASGVPVVASDLVGIPEVVKEPWGRLVPAGDEGALARALAEVMSLTPTDRARIGAAGRGFVVAERDQRRETARLVELITGLGAR